MIWVIQACLWHWDCLKSEGFINISFRRKERGGWGRESFMIRVTHKLLKFFVLFWHNLTSKQSSSRQENGVVQELTLFYKQENKTLKHVQWYPYFKFILNSFYSYTFFVFISTMKIWIIWREKNSVNTNKTTIVFNTVRNFF